MTEVGASPEQVKAVLKAYIYSLVDRDMLDDLEIMSNVDIALDVRDGSWTSEDPMTRKIAAQMSMFFLQLEATKIIREVAEMARRETGTGMFGGIDLDALGGPDQ